MDVTLSPTEGQRRRTAVVIPAYNPDDSLARLVAQLELCEFAVLVVDDGSDKVSPGLWDDLNERVLVIHHERNLGKGAAIKSALHALAGLETPPDCVATMDADGQHRVCDLISVVGAAWAQPNALVLGSRDFSGEVPARSSLGNRLARWAFSHVAHVDVDDTQTGLRAFSGGLIPFMAQVPGARYEYETNVLLACARQGVPIREVPVATIYHDAQNSCSHYRRVRDTLRIVGSLVGFAASSLMGVLLFAASSLTCFGLDFALYVTLLDLFGTNPQTIVGAAMVARVASSSANYALNRSVVFHSDRAHARALPEYAMLALAVLIGDCLVTLLLTQVLGVNALVAKAAAGITLFAVSYLVQRTQVFSPHAEEKGFEDGEEVEPWTALR